MHLQENVCEQVGVCHTVCPNQILCFQIRHCLGQQLMTAQSDVLKRWFKPSVGIRGITLTLNLSHWDRWLLIKKHQVYPKCSGHTFLQLKVLLYNLSRGPNIQYIMTHNLCCITIFLFIFSSPTYDWCDTEGQQRTTILGVWGRQSWTGNHGNTVLASLIPWPCQRVDKYLRMPRSIQHLHKRKPSHSARYEKKKKH